MMTIQCHVLVNVQGKNAAKKRNLYCVNTKNQIY